MQFSSHLGELELMAAPWQRLTDGMAVGAHIHRAGFWCGQGNAQCEMGGSREV